MPKTHVHFEYEPICSTRTGQIVAYEQLARTPHGSDALWLTGLEAWQRLAVDAYACASAGRTAHEKDIPIFMNCFPETLRACAAVVQSNTALALEVHESTPMALVASVTQDYPALWFVLDDVTDRLDAQRCLRLIHAAATTARARVWMKFPASSAQDVLDGALDLFLPGAQCPVVLIQEGARTQDLDAYARRGVPFAQGRLLPGGFRVPSTLSLTINEE